MQRVFMKIERFYINFQSLLTKTGKQQKLKKFYKMAKIRSERKQ